MAEVFSGPDGCVRCHSTADGGTRARADLPLETYEQVRPLADVDTGMAPSALALSSHNHLMGFAVSSLLVSAAFSLTRWRRSLVVALVPAAFLGPVMDVASWWLTREFGHPFEYGVVVGGALYGIALTAMSVLALDEVWLGSRLRRIVARVVPAIARDDEVASRETP